MANSSKILLDLIGPINAAEDSAKISINCLEKEESAVEGSTNKAGLESISYSVLFPKASKSTTGTGDVVPLIGGSILKISLGNEIRLLESAKLGRYDASVKTLAKYAKGIGTADLDSGKQKLSALVEARVHINKTLQNMPNITAALNSNGIPTVYFSSLRSSASSVTSILNTITASGKTRLSLISKVGGLKFIPFEKILSILEALTIDEQDEISEDFGLSNYVGLSGLTFRELRELAYESKPSDENISQILLDLFPIFHVEDKFLEGKKSQGIIGYYTELNENLYIKTPDLSARNSSGVASLDREDEGENLFFCLELVNKRNKDYGALAFEYAFPPDIEVLNSSASFALDDSVVEDITISADSHDSSYRYFLSPIMAPQQIPNVPIGFVRDSESVEMFTAPLLTFPYFDPSSTTLQPIISFEKNEDDFKLIYKNLIDYIVGLSPVSFNLGETAAGADDQLDGLRDWSIEAYIRLYGSSFFFINAANQYNIKDLGIPLTVSGEANGIASLPDLLGEKNRPEIILGSRDFSKETYLRNDSKWFNEKICSTKELMTSVCPNILTELETFSQIPKNWIMLKKAEVPGDDITLSIPYKSTLLANFSDDSGPSGLSGYNPGVESQFALYAVDKYGQIVRASGENIKISPQISILKSVTPDGFSGDGVVLSVSADIEKITITVDSEILDGSIRIFSDEEKSFEIKPDNVDIKFENQNITIKSSNADTLINNLFGSRTGTFYIQVITSAGVGSDNLLPIRISDDSVTISDLPEAPEDKIKFKNPLGLKAPRFTKEIDSIPLLMDGQTNAEIILRYNSPVFRSNLPLYGYVAILKDSGGLNLNILKEDIGWETDTLSTSSLVGVELFILGLNLIVPTKFEYVLGTDEFFRINDRTVKLKFPGPGSKLNISRFNELVGEDGKHKAYIVLSNERIDDGVNFLLPNDYAIIPVGSSGVDGNKPAFINPPYISALAMKLSNIGIGNSKSFSNVSRSYLRKYEKYINEININSNHLEDEYELRTNDKIARLAVIFEGSSSEPRASRSYSLSIGSGANGKKIRNKRFGLIRGEKNQLVANYRDITGVTDTGFLDIIVTKKDRRFNVTYDSAVYNRLTVNFSEDEIIDGSIINVDEDSPEEGALANKLNKLIPELADNSPNGERFVPFPNIFPASIPTKRGSYLDGKNASNTDSYLRFPNPIKIFPSVDLIFGAEVAREFNKAEKEIYGMFLSDYGPGLDEHNQFGEIVKINTNGTSEVLPSISDISDSVDRVREQGEEQLAALEEQKAELRAIKDGPEGLAPEKLQEIDGKIQEAEEKEQAYSEALTAADAAVQAGAEEEQEASAAEVAGGAAAAIVGGVGAATEAANTALGLLEDGLALIQTLTDKLSSLAGLAGQIADGLTQSASAMGPRESDFSRVNIKHIYIDKESSIPASSVDITGDLSSSKLVLTFRFGQTSAIKFNVPEIIRIDDGDKSYGPSQASPFKDFPLRSGQEFYIVAGGATRNTKIELGGRRIKVLNVVPESIYLKFKVRTPELSKTSAYGADPCISLSLTNSNEKHMQIARQLGNDVAIDLEGKVNKSIAGGARSKRGSPKDLKEKLEERYLKFTSVTLDKANVPKELIQSFCDMSFHLTAELTLQLRNFKVLLVPIKVIFCIIDVICALLNPIALVFAIIRLFLCLYDLILLLPQLSVPAMLLALVLHVIELLLCVIIKVLGIVNAINEISTAIQAAVDQRNYAAIITLEETIDEHLASLEADLTVLDPILNVLALFLELLQLTFAFPCQIKTDDDEDACIDPSQLAGLIMSKVVPAGRIVPDALLPMAQSYTTISLDDVGSNGNTPPTIVDPSDILKETSEEDSSTRVVISNTGFGGRAMPGLTSGATGEPVLIGPNGYFEGDLNGDGQHDNVNYRSLRFAGGDFDGTFSLSFTKSTKEFAIFTGPDPRMVRFRFNERGLTDKFAFDPFLAPFFNKKIIDDLQTLDSPPAFLIPDGKKLVISDDINSIGFTSPIDGKSDIDLPGGFFLSRKADFAGNLTFQPKPLTVTFNLQEPGVNPDTLTAEFTPVEVTKTFGSIPMIALIDDEFNIYFVEEADNGQGGIVVGLGETGIPEIKSIHAKMINFPTAPKKKFSREDRSVYRSFAELLPVSAQGLALASQEAPEGITAGQIIVQQQANQNSFNTDPAVALPFTFIDGGTLDKYDYAAGSALEQQDLTRAVDSIKVFDFPTLYVVDMRQLSDDIAAACGASGPTELLLDLPGFTEPDKIEDSIGTLTNCMEAFLGYFNSTEEDEAGVPVGIVPKIRHSLALGKVPAQIPVQDVVAQYNALKDCYEGEIDNVCGFVINPLNTSFKIENDDDETPLAEFVDPEQEGLAGLIEFDIVDELEFDEELAGFPKITGAMEYASGIGDSAIVAVGTKAVVKIIPRDCYDDILSPALDLTESIKIDFLKDETGGAELVAVSSDDPDVIFEKTGGEYTFAVIAPAPGKVQIRATICTTIVQAVTDRGIIDPKIEPQGVEVDCVDDATATIAEENEEFAPGALSKVDRILTILFVPAINTSGYGNEDRDNSAKSAKPSPQTFGTKLEN